MLDKIKDKLLSIYSKRNELKTKLLLLAIPSLLVSYLFPVTTFMLLIVAMYYLFKDS